VFVGSDGTISSPDYASHVTVQTRARPEQHQIAADPLPAGETNVIEYAVSRLNRGAAIDGPLAPDLCLTAQRIVDTAMQSAAEKRTLSLLP
jgi:glucose-fructose oxidoreductase